MKKILFVITFLLAVNFAEATTFHLYLNFQEDSSDEYAFSMYYPIRNQTLLGINDSKIVHNGGYINFYKEPDNSTTKIYNDLKVEWLGWIFARENHTYLVDTYAIPTRLSRITPIRSGLYNLSIWNQSITMTEVMMLFNHTQEELFYNQTIFQVPPITRTG